jgi:hypothetical protein
MLNTKKVLEMFLICDVINKIIKCMLTIINNFYFTDFRLQAHLWSLKIFTSIILALSLRSISLALSLRSCTAEVGTGDRGVPGGKTTQRVEIR